MFVCVFLNGVHVCVRVFLTCVHVFLTGCVCVCVCVCASVPYACVCVADGEVEGDV